MKNWILRVSAAAFAAGLMGSAACGGSSSGCGGGTNINSNGSGSTQMNVACGQGTYLSNNQCIPIPTSTSSNATPAQKVITH